MTQLLVSVRSAMEAEAALRGGAGLIDVKEPKRGSLGRAGDEVIADVVGRVAGRRLVSAALGELSDSLSVPDQASLAYVKWGLAGSASSWPDILGEAVRRLKDQLPTCHAVAVAYADWQRAAAPKPQEVCSFALDNTMGAFLVDTWNKDGSTLLDWLPLHEIERLRERCHAAAIPLALAGSLRAYEIRMLLPLRPDWFAVRGSVCQGQQRGAMVDEGMVRQLARLLQANPSGRIQE